MYGNLCFQVALSPHQRVARRCLCTSSLLGGRRNSREDRRGRGGGGSGSYGGGRDEDRRSGGSGRSGDGNGDKRGSRDDGEAGARGRWEGRDGEAGGERRLSDGRRGRWNEERGLAPKAFRGRFGGGGGGDPKIFGGKDKGGSGSLGGEPRTQIQMALDSGHDMVFGLNPVLAALRSKRREDVYRLWLSDSTQKDRTSTAKEIRALADEANIEVTSRPKGDLNSLCGNRPHQGFILEAAPLSFEPLHSLEECTEPHVWLALDEVTDPMNFGALVRSAFFLQCHGIVVADKNCCGLTPTASKASSGALESMPIHAARNLPAFLQASADNGWKIIGADVHPKATQARDLQLTGPTVLVLGSEGTGLRTNVENVCTEFVQIGSNVVGTVDSLNVSVAGAILLHQLTSSVSRIPQD